MFGKCNFINVESRNPKHYLRLQRGKAEIERYLKRVGSRLPKEPGRQNKHRGQAEAKKIKNKNTG